MGLPREIGVGLLGFGTIGTNCLCVGGQWLLIEQRSRLRLVCAKFRFGYRARPWRQS